MANIVFLAVAAFMVVAASAQTFEGAWTDSVETGGYGGTHYICVDDNQLYGFYSEIGILRATLNGNRATGYWYQGGSLSDRCTYGPAELTISEDGDSFSGKWECEDGSDEDVWNEVRINNGNPSTRQCFRPALSPDPTTKNGLWSFPDNYEWICNADGNGEHYRGHYMYLDGDDFLHGELKGRCVNGVCMGEWHEENGSKGTDLFDRTDDSDLTSTWWTYPIPADVTDEIDDDDLHAVDVYNYRTTTDRQQCNASAITSVSAVVFMVTLLVAAFF